MDSTNLGHSGHSEHSGYLRHSSLEQLYKKLDNGLKRHKNKLIEFSKNKINKINNKKYKYFSEYIHQEFKHRSATDISLELQPLCVPDTPGCIRSRIFNTVHAIRKKFPDDQQNQQNQSVKYCVECGNVVPKQNHRYCVVCEAKNKQADLCSEYNNYIYL